MEQMWTTTVPLSVHIICISSCGKGSCKLPVYRASSRAHIIRLVEVLHFNSICRLSTQTIKNRSPFNYLSLIKPCLSHRLRATWRFLLDQYTGRMYYWVPWLQFPVNVPRKIWDTLRKFWNAFVEFCTTIHLNFHEILQHKFNKEFHVAHFVVHTNILSDIPKRIKKFILQSLKIHVDEFNRVWNIVTGFPYHFFGTNQRKVDVKILSWTECAISKDWRDWHIWQATTREL